jgi:hypothetical protein
MEDQAHGRNRYTTDFFCLVTNEEAPGRKYLFTSWHFAATFMHWACTIVPSTVLPAELTVALRASSVTYTNSTVLQWHCRLISNTSVCVAVDTKR